MASEPVFSAAPPIQVMSHVPAIPNGSTTQAKAEERSGKLTAEQLAAIEDEELLDKMVLHTQVIVLDEFGLNAPLSSKYTSFRVCIWTLNLASYVRVYLEKSQLDVECLHNAVLDLHA